MNHRGLGGVSITVSPRAFPEVFSLTFSLVSIELFR